MQLQVVNSGLKTYYTWRWVYLKNDVFNWMCFVLLWRDFVSVFSVSAVVQLSSCVLLP